MTPTDPLLSGEKEPAQELDKSIKKLKFEAALSELERIVQNMENGDLPLEESIAAYRRGNQLLQHCQQQLRAAEQKIQVFENGFLHDFVKPNGEPA